MTPGVDGATVVLTTAGYVKALTVARRNCRRATLSCQKMVRRLPLLILVALVLAALPASAALASRGQTTSFESPRDLLDPETRPAALDRIQALGVSSLRVLMYWKGVAPKADSSRKPDVDTTDPASYSWGEYDALLDAAKARGMSVLLTVTGPVPRWATEDKKDDLTRPVPSEFAQFMTAVGRHMAGRVSMWSIWNEPNQPQFLAPQYDSRKRPVSPRIYRALYKAALKGLAAAKVPDPKVLVGETSPRGNSHVVAPLTFLRGTFCLDAKDRRQKGCGLLPTAGVAHHAYTTATGPRFVPPGPNDVTIGVLSRLTHVVDRASAQGLLPKHLPLYLTEFGIQSAPDLVSGVPLQRQSEFRALSERIAWQNPRVVAFSQYLLRDDLPDLTKSVLGGRYSKFESGLETSAGKAKPAYDGFRLVLSAIRGTRSVTLWGLVRPARAATTVRLEHRSGAGGAWHALGSVGTSAAGYFSKSTPAVANRQYRVRWTAPDGTQDSGPATRPLR